MSVITSTSRRLPVLAAACLLGVALPAVPAIAKEKVKTKPPAQAETMDVEYDVSISAINAVGSNVDEATLSEILSGNIVDHAEALAGLTATSITVPEISVTVTAERDGEAEEAVITVTDVVLNEVVDGVAGSISLGGIDMGMEEGAVSYAPISASNFNIAATLGLFGLVGTGESREFQTLYTDFASEGGTLEAEDISCTFGAVAGAEVKARPLQVSFAEFLLMAEQMEADADDGEMDPAMAGQFSRIVADMLTAVESSEVTFEGMSCEGFDEDGRAMSFGLAQMLMSAMSPGIYPSISINDLVITVDGDDSLTLGNVTFKETDLMPLVKGLEAAPDDVDEAWFEANMRAMVPSFGGLSFSGLSFDLPDPDDANSRVVGDVEAFDLSLTNYVNGIPSKVDVSATGIQAALPEDSGDETIEQFRSFGITSVDAGFRVAAAWDDVTETIAIEEISFSEPNLATVKLMGQLTNATQDLFDLDEDTVLAAGMMLAVKSLDLNVVDAGLTDIIIATAAKEQGADPASLRPIFAGIAQGTVISMLAGAADAAKMGQAINDFITGNAKTLTIGIDAKEDPGLDMMDFMAAEDDPASLLGKVNISVEAK